MPPRKPSPVGAHVFVGTGLAKSALPYAREIGAETMQVFVSNPRGWAASPGDPLQDEAFCDGCAESSLRVFIHAPYLVNLGSPTPATLTKSVDALRHSVRRGRAIRAEGVVFHAGSAVAGAHRDDAMRSVRERLLPILDELTDDDPLLLVEPTAGGGAALAATVDQLAAFVANLDGHPRLGVCLDTCHLFAAGHDLAKPGGVRSTLNAFVREVGRGRLKLVHANDSKDPLGSGRDRHQTIGEGTIGSEPFAELFRHPAMRGVPVVIETPGKVPEHRRDLALLRGLRDR